MAIPTITGLVVSNDSNGNIISTVTFSEEVTAESLVGISIKPGGINSVSSDGLTLVFVTVNQKYTDTITMDFDSTNTITADSDSGQLAEDLDLSVTNSITAPINSGNQPVGEMQDSVAIQTASLITAKEAHDACQEACT